MSYHDTTQNVPCPTCSGGRETYALTRIDTRADWKGALISVWECAHCGDLHEFDEQDTA